MKNIHGEEITEELFLKKANEEINKIRDELYELDISSFTIDTLTASIHMYGNIMYQYGRFEGEEK